MNTSLPGIFFVFVLAGLVVGSVLLWSPYILAAHLAHPRKLAIALLSAIATLCAYVAALGLLAQAPYLLWLFTVTCAGLCWLAAAVWSLAPKT